MAVCPQVQCLETGVHFTACAPHRVLEYRRVREMRHGEEAPDHDVHELCGLIAEDQDRRPDRRPRLGTTTDPR
jgi:hypothetical protein